MKDKQWYIFTFGSGQPHAGEYVRIYGTYGSARDKMFEKYGDRWAFQYTEEGWKEWEDRRPSFLEETLLEEIDDN